MSNLFELNDQFRELSQRDDLDPTVMKDTLDAIEDSRDQIIAENPNQKIAIKHGRNWKYKLKAFDEWFVNHNEAHKEALKIDPRLRR